jgi:hypothetical protein
MRTRYLAFIVEICERKSVNTIGNKVLEFGTFLFQNHKQKKYFAIPCKKEISLQGFPDKKNFIK